MTTYSSSFYQDISQVPSGYTVVQGLPGNDGSSIPVQTVTGSGPIQINYQNGKHCILNLTGNATLSFIGWPATGNFARLSLQVINGGAFTLTFPTAKWSDAHAVPTITQGVGAEDWLAFTTSTAGATISGHFVGQNYI